jgi:hypothetical protein
MFESMEEGVEQEEKEKFQAQEHEEDEGKVGSRSGNGERSPGGSFITFPTKLSPHTFLLITYSAM